MTESLLLVCRLEVTSDPAVRLQHLGDGRFRMIFRPGLDPSNRLQFRGCLEDWKVDHVRLDVESMRDREPATCPGGGAGLPPRGNVRVTARVSQP